jgi:hypothetical protein
VILRVYVAAPYTLAAFVRVVHEHLEQLGITATATWPLHATGPEDFSRHTVAALRQALATNSADLRGSDAVLVYDPAGEGRETYAEAARAIEWGKAVVWSGPRGLSQFAPGVHRAEDLDDAIRILADLALQRARAFPFGART